ncbi:MAG TPA: hypothetical protein VJL84_03965 [Kiloniellales bacterium]|nr:hypothetical protein [Kiloniellales bacterium]
MRRLLPRDSATGIAWIARATVLTTFVLIGLDAAGVAGSAAIDPNRPLPGDVTTLPQLPEGPGEVRIEPRPSDGDQARPFDPAERPRTRTGEPPELPGGLGPLPGPSNDAMGFTLVESPDGTTYAIASGTFSGGTADAFERFDELNQRAIDVVVFDSPGGLVLEAIELGRYLRERGIATLVPDEALCASACPLAYAGGVERAAGPRAWIGVHRAYLDETQAAGDRQTGLGEGQQLAALCLNHLVEMGISAEAWIPALETPWSQVYFFTAEQLLKTKLATKLTDS